MRLIAADESLEARDIQFVERIAFRSLLVDCIWRILRRLCCALAVDGLRAALPADRIIVELIE